MGVLRWMFTTEGGAATPRLSAGSAALTAGLIGGIIGSVAYNPAVGVIVGLLFAVIVFTKTYPQLREEHRRQAAVLDSGQTAAPKLPRSIKPNLIRLAIFGVVLTIGGAVAELIGSIWVLLGFLVAAPVIASTYGRLWGEGE